MCGLSSDCSPNINKCDVVYFGLFGARFRLCVRTACVVCKETGTAGKLLRVEGILVVELALLMS